MLLKASNLNALIAVLNGGADDLFEGPRGAS